MRYPDTATLRCGCRVQKLDRHNIMTWRCALHVNNEFETTLTEARFHKDPNFPKAYRLYFR